jgi:glycosyltransferase involved in cell wall biosynthesis
MTLWGADRMILHAGSRYRVCYNHVSDAPRTVVCFDPWSGSPCFDGPFFAEEFFRSRAINAIGITPAQNDWYMDAEIEAVLQAIRGATWGHEVTCYGGSMGAYAAINFAPDLQCSRVVALAPQASPDQQKVPFEQRWLQERLNLDCSRDRLGRTGPGVAGYVVYDPCAADDVEHVRLLLAVHDLVAVPIRFSGHHPLAILNETGLTETVLLSMLAGSFERVEFNRRLREQRRLSATYWLNLAEKLADRRGRGAAVAVLRSARRNLAKDSFRLDATCAASLVSLGSLTEAQAILSRWTEDVIYGADARNLLAGIEASRSRTTEIRPAEPHHEPGVPTMPMTGFLAATLIGTPSGPVPIEALIDGEIVPACDGRMLQIVRVRRQRCDPGNWRRRGNLPVRITRNSLGNGLPADDLYAAPDQMLEIDGTLVTARMLMDGAEIGRSEVADPVTYFILEFDSPGAVMIAGIPAWSGETRHIDGQSSAIGALRERLLALRHRAGFTLTGDAKVRIVARGTELLPIERKDNVLVYEFPTGATEFQVVSRQFVPDEIWTNSSDWRCLGVGLAAVRIEHEGHVTDLDLDDPRHQGLHLRQRDSARSWRWTDGRAVLQCEPLPTAGRLTVQLVMAGAYWTRQDAEPPRPAANSMRIVYISGEPDTPGHTYRVERHIDAATLLGHHASWMRVGDVPSRIREITECNALIIWRAPHEGLLDTAIDAARNAGARVIFDVDDLIVEPALATSDVIDAIRSNDIDPGSVAELYGRFRHTAGRADFCTCTTAELGHFLQAMGKPVHVVPNGFDARTLRVSRNEARRHLLSEPDELVRIGYAAGTHTHQRDMRLAAKALARVLTEFPECRLVLFRDTTTGRPMVDPDEFAALRAHRNSLEWRSSVSLADLPFELARLDINIVPIEMSNPYCEAKSELKYFEAALAGVCTVASPTGPLSRVIRDGETGLLARNDREWHSALRQLIRDGSLRRRMATAAYHDVLWQFGPERKMQLLSSILTQLHNGRAAAGAFASQLDSSSARRNLPHIPSHETVHRRDCLGDADATVVIPVFNYQQFLPEALESVARQTEEMLDLVVIDDRSTDDSLSIAVSWVVQNAARFNRVLVLRNLVNSGLGLTRNVGFAAAETPWVLPLDADNRLRPNCIATCLRTAKACGAAYCYPVIQQFGLTTELMNTEDYQPARLTAGNFIDAMALVAKSAWAAVGGYHHVQFGWEDYDFWCRLAELGLWGERVDQVLADYRVHGSSMLRTTTEIERNKRRLIDDMQQRHQWLHVKSVLAINPGEQRRHLTDTRRATGKALTKRRIGATK